MTLILIDYKQTVEDLKDQINTLETERDQFHSELMDYKSKHNELERQRDDEIFDLQTKLSNKDHEINDLQQYK